MKKTILFLIILCINNTFGQKMTAHEWDELAKNDKRLQPKYGHLRKSAEEKKIDDDFIKMVLAKDTTEKKGAVHLIKLGFIYLKNEDYKKAMFRFNQAYLMDSTNVNIYNGFSAVYLGVGKINAAKKLLETGLKQDAKNVDLLLNYGTSHLSYYYEIRTKAAKLPQKTLDTAILYFKKALKLKPTNETANIKLSVCYWNMGLCKEAWKYYDATKAAGGKVITTEYTDALKRKCPR